MPDHTGRRRRQSDLPIARLFVLLAVLVVLVRLLTLSDPIRTPTPSTESLTVAPTSTWSGPAPVSVAGVLADGATYLPRIYLTPDTSVGIASSSDGQVLRVVLRTPGGRATELRRLTGSDHPQFDGFAASGDTLVWAESVSRADAPVSTTLWRLNWRGESRPTLVTSSAGDTNFFGGQYDLVLQDGRVYWAAVGAGNTPATEVRSVALTGGQVSIKRLAGEYALSAWPWAVSVIGGRGTPMELVNLATDARLNVVTNVAEISACSPQWCRMSVLGDNSLVRIDLQRPDGSQRRRIAGNEATPTIVDVALLDRFVPLATDSGDITGGGAGGGLAVSVGLSIYDISVDSTELVAVDVANVQGRDGILWWSTGAGVDLVWHALDLRALA